MASLASRSASQALRAASRRVSRVVPKAPVVSCQVANYSLLARAATGKTMQTVPVRHLMQRIINC